VTLHLQEGAAYQSDEYMYATKRSADETIRGMPPASVWPSMFKTLHLVDLPLPSSLPIKPLLLPDPSAVP